jgi:hypothetical protein
MSVITWNKKQSNVAVDLAAGYSINEAAARNKVSERTIYRWKADIEFTAEVDRLSLMCGIASRAERVRLAKRRVREMEAGGREKEKKPDNLLDWLKYVQSETDGVKLDISGLLAALAENAAPLAGSGPEGSDEEADAEGSAAG